MEEADLKRAIEALLFVADKQLTMEQIKDSTGLSDLKEIKKIIDIIERDCIAENRGFRLVRVAGGIKFVTDPALADIVKSYAVTKEKRKLSAASLETLSIIAYKQPITRQEIEYIRGVNVDGAVRTLVDRGLLKIVGRKDVPGKPLLYGTTKSFLEYFGLGGIKDLPRLAEFSADDIDLPESLILPVGDTNQEMETEKVSSETPGQHDEKLAPVFENTVEENKADANTGS